MACKSATKYSSPDIVILEKNFVLDTICMEVFRNFQPFTIYGVSHSIVSNHDQKGEKVFPKSWTTTYMRSSKWILLKKGYIYIKDFGKIWFHCTVWLKSIPTVC